jgi:hypothetical protein
MNRRSFLGTILALAVAPAVVRASSIMRVRPTLTGWEAAPLTGEIGVYESIRFIEPMTLRSNEGLSLDALHQAVRYMQAHAMLPDADGCYVLPVTPEWISILRA